MNRQTGVLLGSIVVVVVAVFMMSLSTTRRIANSGSANGVLGIEAEPLVLFCAASNRTVIDSIRIQYEREFNRSIQIQYGPSQTLLSSIEVSGAGDLFLPADDSYIELGNQKGLLSEVIPLASMRGVVAVRRGNPKGVRDFSDLLRSDVRLVQSSPDSSAIGKRTKICLVENDHWDRLNAATTAFRTTVTDIANDLVVGAADAGIVYDAVLHSYSDLESIELPQLGAVVSQVSLGVISSSKRPQAALHFARYIAARDRGLTHYAKHGFSVSTGDVWSEVPELSIFAGSMLRPVIEDTLSDFEHREGVKVTRVYNGCGILVAQMRAGQIPDAYFACDREFMNQVPDLFSKPIDISMNELVILVQKGNPRGVSSLRDLARKGLRVGVGHEKQCAMGWLTRNTLREGGVLEEVMENVTVQSPTGDMLVNQLRTGSLDAAVVYLSNAAGAADYLDAIRIQGLVCALATQPYAVANGSPNARMAERLFQRLCSEESRSIFEAEGFRWSAPSAAPRSRP